jgi:hypothetical protein
VRINYLPPINGLRKIHFEVDKRIQYLVYVQWVPGGPFPGAKTRQGRDADQSSPSSTEVENE